MVNSTLLIKFRWLIYVTLSIEKKTLQSGVKFISVWVECCMDFKLVKEAKLTCGIWIYFIQSNGLIMNLLNSWNIINGNVCIVEGSVNASGRILIPFVYFLYSCQY